MAKTVLVLLLLAFIEASYGFPQGFFSQGFSLPRFVQYDSKSQTVELPYNIKVENPIKGSLFNIFGKKNTNVPEKSKKEPAANEVKVLSNKKESTLSIDENYSSVINYKKDESNKEAAKVKNIEKIEEEIIKSITDNEIIYETTTEYIIETTTDDYETTTFIDEPLNRSGASPALVASLLG